jgi:hypothetical protein
MAFRPGIGKITVDVSWGQYRRESIEIDEKSQPTLQRTPREPADVAAYAARRDNPSLTAR